MSIETIATLIALGVTALGGVIALIVAICRGEVKKFIVEKMEEAEKSGMSGKQKLAFVIQAVKEKYKLASLFLNIKKFIEYIISISKGINSK